MSIKDITIKVLPILIKAGVTKSEIFGSYARGDQSEDSDLDLLVEVPEGTSLIDFAGLKNSLEDTLGLKVDLVSYDAVNKRQKINKTSSSPSILLFPSCVDIHFVHV